VTEAEQITAASRSNLALAFIALPKQRRRDISVFYAFCRLVDDIADGDASRADKANALNRWKHAIRAESSDEPSLASEVRRLIADYEIPEEHFQEIIAGVEMDLDRRRYETWEDLRLYCHRVASVVGLVSIAIFGTRTKEAREYALNLGLALQLTNILRDVGEDYGNGERIYVPMEDLRRFHVTEEDLRNGERTPQFLELMDFEARRASSLYEAAKVPPEDRRVLTPAEIMRAVYQTLLQKMQADRWRVFGRRYRLSRWQKGWLVAKQLFRSRF
jgi:15-cis-phytoene synthase